MSQLSKVRQARPAGTTWLIRLFAQCYGAGARMAGTDAITCGVSSVTWRIRHRSRDATFWNGPVAHHGRCGRSVAVGAIHGEAPPSVQDGAASVAASAQFFSDQPLNRCGTRSRTPHLRPVSHSSLGPLHLWTMRLRACAASMKVAEPAITPAQQVFRFRGEAGLAVHESVLNAPERRSDKAAIDRGAPQTPRCAGPPSVADHGALQYETLVSMREKRKRVARRLPPTTYDRPEPPVRGVDYIVCGLERGLAARAGPRRQRHVPKGECTTVRPWRRPGRLTSHHREQRGEIDETWMRPDWSLALLEVRHCRYLSVFQISVASFRSLPTFCHTTTFFPATCSICWPLVVSVNKPISRAASEPSGFTSTVVS